MADCVFCKIANKQIPSEFIYEDEHTVAFRDLNPRAPHHYLIIPKKHVDNLTEVESLGSSMTAALLKTAVAVAKKQALTEGGYRVVINNGSGAGQTVFHLHLHLLGGRTFAWPPG